MRQVFNKKAFWTFVCFIAFLTFTISLMTKMWWLNIFTMILGLAFKYYGDDVVFPQYVKQRQVREEKLQEYLDKRQEQNYNRSNRKEG